jgi:MoaA/NifB/PqqE/SkfB family radical SAM enzyme
MIVVWRVTQKCNLSCPFCAYDRRVIRPRKEADPELMRRFGVVLAEYERRTGDAVLVSWIGGEPLLWRPLTGLTVFFSAELDLRVSTTTNGTSLVSSAVREHVLEHYTELTVSVDGIGEAHDELRGWPGGYRALRESVRWLAAAKRSRERGPRLRANVVLMRQTIGGFEALCRELAGWGIEEITFNQLGGRDRPEFFPAHRLLPEQAEWLARKVPALRTRLGRLGVRLKGGEGYLDRILASSRDARVPVADCHPGQRFVFINEDGMAAPCDFTTESYGVPLAELDCVEALRGLPVRLAQRRRERTAAACRDCHSTQVFEKFAV